MPNIQVQVEVGSLTVQSYKKEGGICRSGKKKKEMMLGAKQIP